MATTYISDEMDAAVGTEMGRSTSFPIAARDIRRWALAVYHPEPPPPLFWDAEHAASALYLGVLTREDLTLCDPDRTDRAQTARPVAWYQRRLSREFQAVGGGLFLRKPLDVTVWHLERG